MTVIGGGWEMATPAEAGFAPDLDECFDICRQTGALPNLHGVIAVRSGRIFLERYFAGPDAIRGTPLGVVRFGSQTLHDLRSISKSIVGLLYGIALAAQRVPMPDARLHEQFPEYPELADDPARQRLTVRHALTMTLGTEWDEFSFPYSDPRNSEIAADRAEDRHRYILEQPIVELPGLRWSYNGGATALLARLITKGTGQSLPEFARAALFEPLGITYTDWKRSADGDVIAASGLRMTPRDLARIGVAVLNDGRWRERQVIPAGWLSASFTSEVPIPDGRHYGFQWYLGSVPMSDGAGALRREEVISASGNGGQRLFLLPRLDLVVVITAGNYDAPDAGRPPTVVLRDVLLPALRAK